jgi:hypothetical protein
MVKNRTSPVPVTSATIGNAIVAADDFGHEMRVKHELEQAGGRVIHGWTYLDPLERKPRQFDLRCRLQRGGPPMIHALALAVECKNLSVDAPLVVSGIARTRDEAFLDFVVSDHTASHHRRRVMRSRRDYYFYAPGDFVGKSLLRLKPANEGERLVPTAPQEADIYQRWSQALASADELGKNAAEEISGGHPTTWSTAVLPLVVVPDKTLWTVAYDNYGRIKTPPEPADEVTFFVNHEVIVTPNNHWMNLSHVHFLTLTGLHQFLAKLDAPGAWTDLFPSSAEQHQVPMH